MRVEMCRVSRLCTWFRRFLYLNFILIALLTFWFAIRRDLYTFDAAFVKDLVKQGASKGNWQEDNSRRDAISFPVSNHGSKKIKVTYNKDSRNISDVNFPKKYSTRNENVKPKKTSSGSFKATLSTRSSLSSTKSLDIPTRVATNSVYEELGCADNPWREDLFHLLRTWVHISKQNNIEYVLACGSLLGAMRDGDIIPYDSDIDILVDVNYFSIIKKLSAERNFESSDRKIRLVVQPEFTLNIPVEVRKRFDCQGKETTDMIDQCSFQEPMARLIKGNLHMELYHFYDRIDTVDDPCEDRLKQYHKKDFYPFRSCSFMGLQASCPNNSWEILRIYFNTDDLEPNYKCKNGTWVIL